MGSFFKTQREFFHMSIVSKRLASAKNGAPQYKQVESKPKNKPEAINAIDKDQTNNAAKQELELFNASVKSDLAQLKKFSTIEEKNEYKATAIEKNDYLTFINRFIASGSNYSNFTFTWVFIWLVDLGRWKQALNYLPHLISQQQNLPTVFNTKEWVTFLIDQLYDAGAKELQDQQQINERTPDVLGQSQIIAVFSAVIAFVDQEKPVVNEVVLGKLYAMAAKLEYVHCNFGSALNHCVAATKVNDKAGVKKLAKDLAKKLNKHINI